MRFIASKLGDRIYSWMKVKVTLESVLCVKAVWTVIELKE